MYKLLVLLYTAMATYVCRDLYALDNTPAILAHAHTYIHTWTHKYVCVSHLLHPISRFRAKEAHLLPSRVCSASLWRLCTITVCGR